MRFIYTLGLLVYVIGCSEDNKDQKYKFPPPSPNAQQSAAKKTTFVVKTPQNKSQITTKQITIQPSGTPHHSKQNITLEDKEQATVSIQDDGLKKLQAQLNKARRDLEKELSK